MALDIGAMPHGNWSGCHAVGWDYNAPEFGDLTVGDGFQKHSYPFGIMVNARRPAFRRRGRGFPQLHLCEIRPRMLKQPDQFAWQIFDSKVLHLLRDEYRIKRVTKVSANTLEELADKLDGVDRRISWTRSKAFNAAVRTDIPFQTTVKDGRRTEGLPLPKSNWANTIDEPPFEAYQVGCGITFTFGGLRVAPESAQVIDTDLVPIPGLYAAGELVGGMFYFNYPSGTGLTCGLGDGQDCAVERPPNSRWGRGAAKPHRVSAISL